MTDIDPGTVYLVGAGPGDPGYVTARARELVGLADVLVYDRLIPPSLVGDVPARCERIDVGKRAGDHTMRQPDINAVLVDRALSGACVVRLKGGDPYLFGRGGEEAAACQSAGVPFEVVSGVTSALSVPAAAGIPVTHRGVSNGVTIITASGGSEGTDDPDYAWLAASEGTVVLLMGLRRVAHVCAELRAGGAPPDRPMAVISRGTTPAQRTVVGTIATIPRLVARARLASPAIIVVGDVVSLRDGLNWFEARPLFGWTIAVTRARAQASTLVAHLQALGAEVVECPSIEVVDAHDEELAAAARGADTFKLCVFTSQNGVRRWFDALHAAGLDARAMHRMQVAVVGDATAAACRERGVIPDVVPPAGAKTSAGLLELLGREALWGTSALVVRAERADESFVAGLEALGAAVTEVKAYRTVVAPLTPEQLDAMQGVDLVTFTSASTVYNLSATLPDTYERPPAISIGPVTTAAATATSWEIVAQATDPSVRGVVAAVLHHARDSQQHSLGSANVHSAER